MKTLNLISAVTVLIFTMTTFEINASTPDLNLKGFDFGGNEIMENSLSVESSFDNIAMPEFDLEEEAYIEDIPFDTECVTANCRYAKAMSVVFNMEEEEYIEDIPFNTKNIAENSNLEELDFEDEAYIDDIPFNTALKVFQTDFKNNLTVK